MRLREGFRVMAAITIAPKASSVHIVTPVAAVTYLGLFYGIVVGSLMASVTS